MIVSRPKRDVQVGGIPAAADRLRKPVLQSIQGRDAVRHEGPTQGPNERNNRIWLAGLGEIMVTSFFREDARPPLGPFPAP